MLDATAELIFKSTWTNLWDEYLKGIAVSWENHSVFPVVSSSF